MSIKSDKWIKEMAQERQMIAPFNENKIRKGVISFGLSSYGYDITICDEFKIFAGNSRSVIDPKNFGDKDFASRKGAFCVVPANSYVLARSAEYLKIPRNVLALCFGKSSYARCGIIVNVTPLEPAWEGCITIAISNAAPSPVKVYANEGIAQVVFYEAEDECAVSYADKKGVYQGQKEITLTRVR